MTGWRPSALAHEATENIVSSGSRLAMYALLCVASGVGLASVATADAARFTNELRVLEANGWTTAVVASSASGQETDEIDADSCAALATVDGVEHSGGVRYVPAQSIAQLGSGAVTVALVDWRFTGEVGDSLAYLGSKVATETGYPSNVRLVTVSGSGSVYRAAEMPAELEAFSFGSTIAIPSNFFKNDVPGCLIWLSPWAVGELNPALGAAVSSKSGEITVASLHSETFNPLSRHLNRSSRWLPLVAGAALGLVYILLVRSRSSELASYRLAGTSRLECVTLLQMEQLVVSGVFFASAMVGLFAFRNFAGRDAIYSWPYIGLGAIVLYFASVPGWLLAVRRPVMDMAKDR